MNKNNYPILFPSIFIHVFLFFYFLSMRALTECLALDPQSPLVGTVGLCALLLNILCILILIAWLIRLVNCVVRFFNKEEDRIGGVVFVGLAFLIAFVAFSIICIMWGVEIKLLPKSFFLEGAKNFNKVYFQIVYGKGLNFFVMVLYLTNMSGLEEIFSHVVIVRNFIYIFIALILLYCNFICFSRKFPLISGWFVLFLCIIYIPTDLLKANALNFCVLFVLKALSLDLSRKEIVKIRNRFLILFKFIIKFPRAPLHVIMPRDYLLILAMSIPILLFMVLEVAKNNELYRDDIILMYLWIDLILFFFILFFSIPIFL